MRVKMKRTIEERDGEKPITYQKGTFWNVSEAKAKGWCDGDNPAAELAPDVPNGVAKVSFSVSKGETTVSVTAYPDVPFVEGRAPQIRLDGMVRTARIDGPAVGQWVSFTNSWTFARPKGKPGTVRIIGQCHGFAPGVAEIEIPPIGSDNVEETKAGARKATRATAEE